MAIREVEFKGGGTALKLIGGSYEGKLSIDIDGFKFHNSVAQNDIIELLPVNCSPVDARLGNIFKVSLTSSITNFDIDYADVGTYIFIFVQDSTGGKTVSFADNFYFISGLGAPYFSGDSSNTINIVSFLCDGQNFYGTYMQDFVNS